jgi:DNA-directed RNA polymerase subunit K/omega
MDRKRFSIVNPNIRRKHVVPPDEHITSDLIQKGEFTELLSVRASHLEQGAPPMVNVTGVTSSHDKALLEFLKGKIPLLIERSLNDPSIVEIKDPNTMKPVEPVELNIPGVI